MYVNSCGFKFMEYSCGISTCTLLLKTVQSNKTFSLNEFRNTDSLGLVLERGIRLEYLFAKTF